MLSIVVNFLNNRREAEITLQSVTRGYQKVQPGTPYEVIALRVMKTSAGAGRGLSLRHGQDV
jgi:hypothetical protein